MELMFGNPVRHGSRRIGSLAGVEVDIPTRRVTKIIFSHDGKLGSHAQTRSLDGVRVERKTVVVGEAPAGQAGAAEPLLLSRSVRVLRADRQAGHVIGVLVGDQGVLDGIIGRQHWWSGRFRVKGSDLDLSRPGEIRTAAPATRAA